MFVWYAWRTHFLKSRHWTLKQCSIEKKLENSNRNLNAMCVKSVYVWNNELHFEFPKTIWNITPWLWTKIASKTLKEFDMHQNIFMHHVNFDGYFLTVEIEKTCVMSYSNISLSEQASLNERCKLSHSVYYPLKIIFFRSSCTYSHRYIPSTPLSFFQSSVGLPLLCTRVSLLFSSVSWEYDLKKHMCLCTTVKFFLI